MKSFDTFAIWAPFEVLEKATKANKMTARIGGIISTQAKDQQGETIDQKGISWDYFVKHGWFNYEHKQGPENILGHPEVIVETSHGGKPATRVEGVLYLHKAKALEIYETAEAMKKAGGGRQLGFSVEGQVLGREKNQILKSRVLNVAITAHPVNPDARLEVLARSIGYQTPAVPADPGISSLVPQSMDFALSAATFGQELMRKKRLSVGELGKMLTDVFSHLDSDEAQKLAQRIANSMN
jgi:hypothetical protein